MTPPPDPTIDDPAPLPEEELCFVDACSLAATLRSGEISSSEVVGAFLSRIERLDPQIGSICTLVPEKALRGAERADRLHSSGEPLPPLHGLPIAIKDLALTAGIRSTSGSPILIDFVPEISDLFVRRLQDAGAIVIGKTNTPEFGAGSQTFNPIFGATHNPWDLSKTAGGSSGGAAAALAARLLPFADGSDLGGSLRNPASFCNVVGLRPSPGRVPRDPDPLPWEDLSVLGPMARNVDDLALLFSAMAGPDPRSPIASPDPGSTFAPPIRPLEPRENRHSTSEKMGLQSGGGSEKAGAGDGKPVRIAWTPHLGQADLARYPFEPEAVEVCERAIARLAGAGFEVDSACPDFSGADSVFQVLRAWLFAARLGPLLGEHRAQMKDTVIWNVERGLRLRGQDISRAMTERGKLFRRMVEFFERYDFLALPTVQVLPFSVDTPYPTEIAGHPMATYLDWMASCSAITVTTLPAISMPAGFSRHGLPVGVQIVGPPKGDLRLLRLARAFEEVTGYGARVPLLDADSRGGQNE